MTRIFPALALFAAFVVGGVMIVGLSLGDVRDKHDQATQTMATLHRLSGVGAALVVVLVNSIVVTYFVGTSRWCREVVETYALDVELVRRANRCKRRAFPFAVVGMLAAVVMVALGGAADPGATAQLAPVGGWTWAQIHLGGALLGLAVIVWGFAMQWASIGEQREVISEIMNQVQSIRAAKGID